MNPSGEIVGFYYDANWYQHGFLRNAKSVMTTFDVAGLNANPWQ